MSDPDKQILTSLISMSAADSLELQAAMAGANARLIAWPLPESIEPTYSYLDDAIADLYGYDWLIFINQNAVRYFLARFEQQGHEVRELDSLKVCAIGEASVEALENSHVHIDVIPSQYDASAVIEELSAYAGQPGGLNRLNFLIPQARVGRDYLRDALVGAGARVDTVEAYQTTAGNDSSLIRLFTMLKNGGIDGALLSDPEEVQQLATLFDRNDLGKLFDDVPVFVPDESTLEAARQFGLRPIIVSPGPNSSSALSNVIRTHFSMIS